MLYSVRKYHIFISDEDRLPMTQETKGHNNLSPNWREDFKKYFFLSAVNLLITRCKFVVEDNCIIFRWVFGQFFSDKIVRKKPKESVLEPQMKSIPKKQFPIQYYCYQLFVILVIGNTLCAFTIFVLPKCVCVCACK